MKLISVQLFTIIFVSIYCFEGVSMQFIEDDRSTSLPINPSFSSNAFNPSFKPNPINPSNSFRRFNPSSTFSSYIPSSTFFPTSTFRTFNPSQYSSSTNIAQFLAHQPTTSSSIQPIQEIGANGLEKVDSRKFFKVSDVVPAIVNIPALITNHLQATRRLIVNFLGIIANTIDLFISSAQMGKSNVHVDLVNIGKNYMEFKESYLNFVELMSNDLIAVSTQVRKLPGVEHFKFIVEWPLEMIQTVKNFLMSLVKPEDPDFKI